VRGVSEFVGAMNSSGESGCVNLSTTPGGVNVDISIRAAAPAGRSERPTCTAAMVGRSGQASP